MQVKVVAQLSQPTNQPPRKSGKYKLALNNNNDATTTNNNINAIRRPAPSPSELNVRISGDNVLNDDVTSFHRSMSNISGVSDGSGRENNNDDDGSDDDEKWVMIQISVSDTGLFVLNFKY